MDIHNAWDKRKMHVIFHFYYTNNRGHLAYTGVE
jgi:hypothetical protein